MSAPPDSPAFVHVDLDNLWAVAECYGLAIPPETVNFVYEDGLKRLERLFRECGIAATLFVVGRDLFLGDNVHQLKTLRAAGHRLANHSQNHLLSFRSLDEREMEREVAESEEAIRATFGERPLGFRAPGYGISRRLLSLLAARGYSYDCSAMPGPYGGVFRFLDARLRAQAFSGRSLPAKTQYSRVSDMLAHPLMPHEVPSAGGASLLEIPSATSPFLRLPFQAGVCMRLGRRYFDLHLAAFRRRRDLPLLFLLHGADVTNFAALPIPFFRNSPFFSAPVEEKEAALRYFLTRIRETYPVVLTEDWLKTRPGG